MASLNRHLREAGSHGQLPFHPTCAVCARERLSGTLGGDALLGTRTQAGLLAATLAVSGLAAPGAALAGGDPMPAQAPGEGELDNGLAEPDADVAPDSEDAEPIGDNLLAPDPDDGADAPEATPLSDPVTPVEELEAEPAEPEVVPVAPAPPVAVPPVEAPPPPAPVPQAKPSVLVDPAGSTRARVQTLRLKVVEVKSTPTAHAAPAPPAAEPTVTHVADTAAPPPPETGSAAGQRVAGGAYKVQPGDSLWSIAQRRLPGQATTGQVAREVHRLWELNKDRIATGDPDLLMVGTMLRLP